MKVASKCLVIIVLLWDKVIQSTQKTEAVELAEISILIWENLCGVIEMIVASVQEHVIKPHFILKPNRAQ